MTTWNERLSNLFRSRTAGVELGEARWIVIARVEDDRSDFAPEQRITHRTIDELIETFDSERRQVPVICAQGEPIGGHGTEALPPVGQVVALSRDDINLWGKVRSFVDPVLELSRLDLCVSIGYDQRSIGFRTSSNETGGRPSLVHLALLAGQQPGISNMPTLSAQGLGLEDDQLEKLRTRFDDVTVSRVFLPAAGREWAAYGGADAHRALDEDLVYRGDVATRTSSDDTDHTEDSTMTMEELRALMGTLATSVQTLQRTMEASFAQPATPEESDSNQDRSQGDQGDAEAQRTQAPEPPAKQPSVHQRATVTDQQRAQITGAVNQLSGLGILNRSVAKEQAAQAVSDGPEAVGTFLRMARGMIDSRRGSVFQEVRTARGPVRVNLESQQFRVLSIPGVRVDEGRLAVLSQAMQELPQDKSRVDPAALERAANNLLREATFA